MSNKSARPGPRRITQDSLDAVIARSDIVDLISGHTQLVQRGHEFLGKCPFHDERTPSFWVNPAKGVYHCFGCGASGDTVDFVKEKQALDFAEAIEFLGDRYRVEVEWEGARPGDEQRRSSRKRQYDLLETACAFYESYLWQSGAAVEARSYLAGRDIDEATAKVFRIGFSPAASDGTSKRALAKGYTREELTDVRLVSAKGNDFFRARLMIPIMDRAGRVIAFGARKLRDEQFGGKYMNSADSSLFHKKETLYTSPDARVAARESGSMLVVEGYMDVIALHMAGFPNSAAVMGTAIGERQVTELKRLAPRAYFAFDPDTAGEAATLRALAAAGEQELDVRVIVLPEGKDPADVIGADRAAGKLAMQELIDKAVPLLEYRVSTLLSSADLASGPGRSQAYNAALDLFGAVPEGPERSEQVFRFADRLQLDTGLRDRLLTVKRRPPAERAGSDGARGGRGATGTSRGTSRGASETPEEAERRERDAEHAQLHGGGGGTGGSASRGPARMRLTNAQRIERLFLAVAQRVRQDAPDTSAIAAAGVGEDHFTLDVHRRAWHELTREGGGALDIARVRGDSELAELTAELMVLSDRDKLAQPQHLQELAVRLDERRVDRTIAQLREQIAGTQSPEEEQLKELARLELARRELKAQIAGWTDPDAPQ